MSNSSSTSWTRDGTRAAGQSSEYVSKVICFFKCLKDFLNGGVDSFVTKEW